MTSDLEAIPPNNVHITTFTVITVNKSFTGALIKHALAHKLEDSEERFYLIL